MERYIISIDPLNRKFYASKNILIYQNNIDDNLKLLIEHFALKLEKEDSGIDYFFDIINNIEKIKKYSVKLWNLFNSNLIKNMDTNRDKLYNLFQYYIEKIDEFDLIKFLGPSFLLSETRFIFDMQIDLDYDNSSAYEYRYNFFLSLFVEYMIKKLDIVNNFHFAEIEKTTTIDVLKNFLDFISYKYPLIDDSDIHTIVPFFVSYYTTIKDFNLTDRYQPTGIIESIPNNNLTDIFVPNNHYEVMIRTILSPILSFLEIELSTIKDTGKFSYTELKPLFKTISQYGILGDFCNNIIMLKKELIDKIGLKIDENNTIDKVNLITGYFSNINMSKKKQPYKFIFDGTYYYCNTYKEVFFLVFNHMKLLGEEYHLCARDVRNAKQYLSNNSNQSCSNLFYTRNRKRKYCITCSNNITYQKKYSSYLHNTYKKKFNNHIRYHLKNLENESLFSRNYINEIKEEFNKELNKTDEKESLLNTLVNSYKTAIIYFKFSYKKMSDIEIIDTNRIPVSINFDNYKNYTLDKNLSTDYIHIFSVKQHNISSPHKFYSAKCLSKIDFLSDKKEDLLKNCPVLFLIIDNKFFTLKRFIEKFF